MDQSYFNGYIAGYRKGIHDALSGKIIKAPSNNIYELPLQTTGLSTRAINCLHRAGCTTIADVAVLSKTAIATMRNLGEITAKEIATWLNAHQICYTLWDEYL